MPLLLLMDGICSMCICLVQARTALVFLPAFTLTTAVGCRCVFPRPRLASAGVPRPFPRARCPRLGAMRNDDTGYFRRSEVRAFNLLHVLLFVPVCAHSSFTSATLQRYDESFQRRLKTAPLSPVTVYSNTLWALIFGEG